MGPGVTHILGDIAEYNVLKEAMTGCEAVFHLAAKTGMWGKEDVRCGPPNLYH